MWLSDSCSFTADTRPNLPSLRDTGWAKMPNPFYAAELGHR